jgi:hypothetical protein
MNKAKISVLIASCDEGHLLEDCLKSLQFCDEIVGVNLESTDNSKELMLKYCTSYIEHKRVAIIEEIHPIFIPQLKHEWFIVIDPDERILPQLALDLVDKINTVDTNIAAVRVPMFNYFRGKKLEYTVYGGLISFRMLYKKSGVFLDNDIHKGIKMKDGFDRIKIHYSGNNFDQHYWCNSWNQLFEKHNRYLLKEGQAQYNSGVRYTIKKQFSNAIIQFYYSFKTKKGYRAGITGLLLSIMAARYEFLKWKSLKEYCLKNT